MFTVTDCGIIIIINIHISNDYSLTRFPKYYEYESKFNSQKCNTKINQGKAIPFLRDACVILWQKHVLHYNVYNFSSV